MNQDESEFMPPENDQLIEGLSELDELRERGLDSSRSMPTIHHLMDELDTYVRVLQEEEPSRGLEIIREPECEQAVRGIALASLDHALSERAEQSSGSTNFTPGQVIGIYELLEPIGQGGMGTVYRARHQKLNQEVALKVLPSWKMRNPKSIARFEREMRAVGKLNHLGIVKALDAGQDRETHYLAMELVEGITLSQLLRQSGTLAIPDACEIIRQVAEALQYIHDQGLIHRDIKPSNLMLTRDGEVKILDLGLAQITGELDQEELTRTGQVMGTIDYMAPEQALDSGTVDHRADIYSLGITFYKLLSGVTPFGSEKYQNPLQKTRAMLDLNAPSTLEYRSDVPETVDRLNLKMINRDVKSRMQSCEEIIEHISGLEYTNDLKTLAEQSVALSASTQLCSSTMNTMGRSRRLIESLGKKTFSRRSKFYFIVFVFLMVAIPFSLSSRFGSDQAVHVAPPDTQGSQGKSKKGPQARPLVPLGDYAGFAVIKPFEQMDQMLPLGLSVVEGGPQMVGLSRSRISGQASGIVWTPESGISRLDELDGYRVREILDVRGDLFLCMTPAEFEFLWHKDSGADVLKYARQNYHPQKLISDSGRTLGALRLSPSEFHLAIEDSQIGVVDVGSPTEKGAYISIVDCTENGEIVVGLSFASQQQGQIKCSWIWTESAGFECPQIETAPDGEVIAFHVHRLSANGRYLCGNVSDGNSCIYDRVEEQWKSSAHELPAGICTGISDDALIAVGYQPGRGGWIWKDGVGVSVDEYLSGRGIDSSDLLLHRVLGISPDGSWIWGVLIDSETRAIHGWVINTQLENNN